uniref:Uncharacterized protein n=1 Tax=candidate division WOR-3 bacterium TaxID=2052148 RepID=A0A7V0Z6B4_UNCW3
MKNRITISILLCTVIGFFTLCTKKEPVKTASGELKITNLVFCSEEPEGYMKYDEQLMLNTNQVMLSGFI